MTRKEQVQDRVTYWRQRVQAADKFFKAVGGLRALKDLENNKKELKKAEKRVSKI